MRRIARDLLDPEVRLGDAGDLWQVRDRQELCSGGEARECISDCVGRRAADASVDLVEDHRRLPGRGVGDGPKRQRDPGELATGGGHGGRRKREAGIRAHEERDAVAPSRARLARGELDSELAVAHPETSELLGDGLGERLRRLGSRRRESGADLLSPLLGLGERTLGLLQRIGACFDLRQLDPGCRRAGEQLVRVDGAEATSRFRDPLELRLDRVQTTGLGLERGEKGVERRGALPHANLGVGQVGGDLAQLRRKRGHGLERPHGLGHPRGRAALVPMLGIERVDAGLGRPGELRDVPEPRALGEQPLLVARLHAIGARDQLAELGELLRAAGRGAGELLAAAAGCEQLPPGPPEVEPAPKLCVPDERIEDVELVRGSRQPALLELARHREKLLNERRQILARDRASPSVRARAAVGEDAARGDEAFFARRTQLGDRLEPGLVEDPLGQVELGFDVGLLGAGAEVRRVTGSAQEQSDGLGEDRLAGARLPGDGVEAGREPEVGLTDEDEALDAEATEQGGSYGNTSW